MRKLILLSFFVFVAVCVSAQKLDKPTEPEFRPDWIYSTPVAGNDTYDYVVVKGEGATKQEALNSATARVLVNVCATHGEHVSYTEVFNEIQKGGDHKKIKKIKLAINKADDFFIRENDNTWTVHVIFQVQKSQTKLFKPDHCVACNDNTIYKQKMQEYERELKAYNDSVEKARKDSIAAADKAKEDSIAAAKEEQAKKDSILHKYNTSIIASSFVPGMAQIKKGSTGKGVGFICGEVVFVGGTIVSECLYRQYKNQINKTSGKEQQAYVQAAHICQITRNVCIAGIAATYIWNVIDGIVAKDYNKPSVGSTTFQFSPYVSLEDAGMAVNITF